MKFLLLLLLLMFPSRSWSDTFFSFEITSPAVYSLPETLSSCAVYMWGRKLPVFGGIKRYFYAPVMRYRYSVTHKGELRDESQKSAQFFSYSGGGVKSEYFWQTVTFEKNYYYVPYPLEGTSGVHWYWGYAGGGVGFLPPGGKLKFSLFNLYCNELTLPVTFYVYGFPYSLYSQFKIVIEINREPYFTSPVTDYRYSSYNFTVTCGEFAEDNVLSFKGVSDERSGIWIDRISIKYPSRFRVREGKLFFQLFNNSCFSIENANPPYVLLKIDNPFEPLLVNYGDITSFSSSIRVCLPPGNYFFQELNSAQQISVKRRKVIIPDLLPEPDVVVVAYPGFLTSPAMEEWINRRSAEGLNILKISTDEIYHWFSFDNKTPWAIVEFLRYMKKVWFNFPKYLLLVGMSTSAPRNDILSPPGARYLEGKWDLVPSPEYRSLNENPQFISSIYRFYDTGSDFYYADPDSDGVIDYMVGRLPVTDETELRNILNKIVRFETANSNYSVIVNDRDNNGFDFSNFADEIVTYLPPEFPVFRIDLTNISMKEAHSELIKKFSEGGRYLIYTGHGFFTFWSAIYDEPPYYLLSVEPVQGRYDLNKMQISPSPFIVFQITCFANSIYYHYYPGSLGRNLVVSDRGASASMGFTDYSEYNSQKEFSKYLVTSFFDRKLRRVGDALYLAFQLFLNDHPDMKEVAYTFSLIGDPTMNLWGYSSASSENPTISVKKPSGKLAMESGDKSAEGCSSMGIFPFFELIPVLLVTLLWKVKLN